MKRKYSGSTRARAGRDLGPEVGRGPSCLHRSSPKRPSPGSPRSITTPSTDQVLGAPSRSGLFEERHRRTPRRSTGLGAPRASEAVGIVSGTLAAPLAARGRQEPPGVSNAAALTVRLWPAWLPGSRPSSLPRHPAWTSSCTSRVFFPTSGRAPLPFLLRSFVPGQVRVRVTGAPAGQAD